jgi:hypothetical protein
MKNNITLLFSLLFLIPLTSCSQKDQNLDQLFYELNGPVNTMTIYIELSENTMKEVYYFNKKGELEKIDHFNSFSNDEPVKIGNVTHFEKQEGNTRSYYQTEFDRKKMVEKFSIELIGQHQINYRFENEKGYKINREITYNQQNKPLKSISRRDYYADSMYIQREYFYDENEVLAYTITTNKVENTVDKIEVRNTKFDQNGNVTYEEYVDKTGKVVYTFKREITYY